MTGKHYVIMVLCAALGAVVASIVSVNLGALPDAYLEDLGELTVVEVRPQYGYTTTGTLVVDDACGDRHVVDAVRGNYLCPVRPGDRVRLKEKLSRVVGDVVYVTSNKGPR